MEATEHNGGDFRYKHAIVEEALPRGITIALVTSVQRKVAVKIAPATERWLAVIFLTNTDRACFGNLNYVVNLKKYFAQGSDKYLKTIDNTYIQLSASSTNNPRT